MSDNPLLDALRAPKNLAFLGVALAGFAADQVTKWWVVQNIELHRGEIQIIDGWLSFVHERNEGAAFSSFEGWFGLFVVFTIIAIGVLAQMQYSLRRDAVFMGGTLGLILSGALGNFADRLRFRYVVDFVKCYTDHPDLKAWAYDTFGTATYPIWNVADAAILVGVVLFLLYSTFNADEEPEEGAAADGAEAAAQ